MMTDGRTLDLAGVGIGPFNLSLAALLDEVPGCRAMFFDSNPEFNWHPGLMLPGARMQTSCLKDLVTPVNPKSPWSFMNFLVSQGRFYDFLSLESFVISRQEFTAYLSWVASQLDNLKFSEGVREISFSQGQFELRMDNGRVKASNICLGTGKKPHIPACAARWAGPDCFHASEIGQRRLDLSGQRVAVIGGGQTGAEIFMNSLKGFWGKPEQVSWVSRRASFEPLDESPFTNQYFTPSYVQAFHQLPAQRKKPITDRQKLASDGITPVYLAAIYEELYHRTYVDQRVDHMNDTGWSLLSDRTLTGMSRQGTGYCLQLNNALQDATEQIVADYVILCTGFEYSLPQCLEPLLTELDLTDDNRLKLDSHFRAQWHGPDNRGIYAVNSGLHSHGIAEPQLSLNAWRAATIINDLLGETHFSLPDNPSLIRWQSLNLSAVSQNAA